MVDPRTRAALVGAVERVQALPYTWPAAPDADSTRAHGRGTCAGKHAVLREDLQYLGLSVQRLMVVGLLVPGLWPDLRQRATGLLEVHECLTVQTPWAGPLLLDVTWHPAAVRAGLAGSVPWTGERDMACAVPIQAAYAVDDADFRQQKELLRNRLYSKQQRALRDAILAEVAERASRFGLT